MDYRLYPLLGFVFLFIVPGPEHMAATIGYGKTAALVCACLAVARGPFRRITAATMLAGFLLLTSFNLAFEQLEAAIMAILDE